jgi:hypothetical protein
VTQAPGAPLTPEQAAHNRKVIRVVAVVFVAVSLAVTVWGFMLVAQQREMASRTDRALRSTAWTILCYAAEHNGTFPTAADQLAGVNTRQTFPQGKGWPPDSDTAVAEPPFMEMEEAGTLVTVTWPPHGNLAPVVGVKTNVSGIGTQQLVNSWLAEFAHAKVVDGARTLVP